MDPTQKFESTVKNAAASLVADVIQQHTPVTLENKALKAEVNELRTLIRTLESKLGEANLDVELPPYLDDRKDYPLEVGKLFCLSRNGMQFDPTQLDTNSLLSSIVGCMIIFSDILGRKIVSVEERNDLFYAEQKIRACVSNIRQRLGVMPYAVKVNPRIVDPDQGQDAPVRRAVRKTERNYNISPEAKARKNSILKALWAPGGRLRVKQEQRMKSAVQQTQTIPPE